MLKTAIRGNGSWSAPLGRGQSHSTAVAAANNSPDCSTSPNPYKRRGLLRRRDPQPQRKFDIDRNSSCAGVRPPLLTSPVSTSVAPGGESPSWNSLSAPGTPRSNSPNKRPWYPAGRRPSSRDSGESGADDSAYVVHPSFRHLFTERAHSSGANDPSRSRQVHSQGPYHGASRGGGSGGENSVRRPGTAAFSIGGGGPVYPSSTTEPTVARRSERPGEVEPAAAGRWRDFHFSKAKHNPPEQQHRDATTKGIGSAPDASSRQRGGERASFSPTDRSSVFESKSDASPPRPRRNNHRSPREMGGQRPYAGRETVEQEGAPLESVAAMRGRVRDMQARGRPRRKERGGRMPPADSRRGEGDPRLRSSAVFIGHSEQVLALARREDILFSASADGTAKAWDTYSQQCLATYKGHQGAVWGMQVTGRTLITGSADGTVRFWDIETAQSLCVLDLHSAVRDVVVVGDCLAVATSDPGVEIVELKRMRRHGTLEGHLLAVSAMASLEGENLLVSGSHDTFLRQERKLWDPDTLTCQAVLGGHGGTVGAICTVSWPQGGHGHAKRAGEEALVVSGSGDGTARVWGQHGVGVKGERDWTCRAVLEGHRHGVWAVHGLSLSGAFATGGGDATVKLWAPTTTNNAKHGDEEAERDNLGSGQSRRQQQQQQQRWEVVGGVRGTAGAVGAVLIDEQALVFGTSEALIARFPLQLCMPAR
ncbi:unnamed protein product [Ectocarpus sp. 12 AP-2014]